MRTVPSKLFYLLLLVMLVVAVVFAVRPNASLEARRAVGMTQYPVERQLEDSGHRRGLSPRQAHDETGMPWAHRRVSCDPEAETPTPLSRLTSHASGVMWSGSDKAGPGASGGQLPMPGRYRRLPGDAIAMRLAS